MKATKQLPKSFATRRRGAKKETKTREKLNTSIPIYTYDE